MEFPDIIFQILNKTSVVSVFLPLFFAARYFSQLRRWQKMIAVFVFVSAFTEITASTLGAFGLNNHPLVHGFVLLEFTLLTLSYFFQMKRGIGKATLLLSIGVFCSFSLYYSIYEQSVMKFNSLPRTIEASFFIVLAFIFFLRIVGNAETGSVLRNPVFWINSGILIYFSGSVFVFFVTDFLSEKNPDLIWILYSVFHSLSNIAFNLAVARGLWMAPKTYQQQA